MSICFGGNVSIRKSAFLGGNFDGEIASFTDAGSWCKLTEHCGCCPFLEKNNSVGTWPAREERNQQDEELFRQRMQPNNSSHICKVVVLKRA